MTKRPHIYAVSGLLIPALGEQAEIPDAWAGEWDIRASGDVQRTVRPA